MCAYRELSKKTVYFVTAADVGIILHVLKSLKRHSSAFRRVMRNIAVHLVPKLGPTRTVFLGQILTVLKTSWPKSLLFTKS